ncbi:hypothetical protein H072_2622 [Dactylellina haptotyla CBS 200.50]|uniref:Carboxypeptidase n=1 Tax=Dactylellina haptotyla (strain CBS 200.50) TaxID=1284197 RepID=S8C6U7_DACHA|nr:hypothetical protein H072_2622 [Dactylellina haptotyla CBS 200.50]
MGVFKQGPSLINAGQPVRNPYSLTNKASVIFIDQPVNVGFSHSKARVANSGQGSKYVVSFLKLWFEKFPKYRNLDFHIAAESYGGTYASALTKEIIADGTFKLKSVIIGSAVIDAKAYFPQYYKMPCGLTEVSPSLVSNTTCQKMAAAAPECLKQLDACYDNKNDKTCFDASSTCWGTLGSVPKLSGRNWYDIRQTCGQPGVECELKDLDTERYVNQPSVLRTLGVESTGLKYASCDEKVFGEFWRSADAMKPHHRNLADALKANIPVFIYGGDADMLCPVRANLQTAEELVWGGSDEFKQARFQGYTSRTTGKKVGLTKSAKGLKFTRIHDAGHEVGWYQMDTLEQMYDEWFQYVKTRI